MFNSRRTGSWKFEQTLSGFLKAQGTARKIISKELDRTSAYTYFSHINLEISFVVVVVCVQIVNGRWVVLAFVGAVMHVAYYYI